MNPSNSTHVGTQYSGLVEVYHGGEWWTVCNTGWSYEDALVVCRTAGFATAVRSVWNGNEAFGLSNETVYLDGVTCNGTEENFFDCYNYGWGIYGRHCTDGSSDAGVVCADSKCTLHVKWCK